MAAAANIEIETETVLPFTSANFAFEGIAKRHHLILPAKLVVYNALTKGDNHSGVLYRVQMSGTQGDRFTQSYADKENRMVNYRMDELSPTKATAVENGGQDAHDDAKKPEHSEVKLYNTDDYSNIPYKKGQKIMVSFICKTAPRSEVRRKLQDVHAMYEREVLIFTKLITRFRNMQNIQDIKDKVEFPRLYAYHLKNNEEFLILEDLRESGYQMHCRQASADLDHGALAMKEIGKFHALSFALQIQHPNEYQEFKRMLDNVFPLPVPNQYSSYWEKSFDGAVNTLDASETHLKQKMVDFKPDFIQTMCQFATGNFTEPLACVNHGDFTNNNMMFVYQNGKPTKVEFLDFQMARYASPTLDVVQYLFCSTDSEFRRKHYDEMTEIYYKAFKSFVELLGCGDDKAMSNVEFRTELKKHGVFGMCMAIVGLMFFLSTDKDDVDMEVMSLRVQENDNIVPQNAVSLGAANSVRYKARMSGIIKDCFAYGYLPK